MTEPSYMKPDIAETSKYKQTEDVEKYKTPTPKYLINEDKDYKILVLYILRTLDTEIIQNIYNLLFTHELIDLMKESWLDTILNNDSDDDSRDNNIYLDIDTEGYLDYY